ncbi:hypothetical protein BUY26_12775 [Staphylococcus cohnii]|nr:hypothetical protein BUY26_12775 [Staphylococcus cohnii]
MKKSMQKLNWYINQVQLETLIALLNQIIISKQKPKSNNIRNTKQLSKLSLLSQKTLSQQLFKF